MYLYVFKNVKKCKLGMFENMLWEYESRVDVKYAIFK